MPVHQQAQSHATTPSTNLTLRQTRLENWAVFDEISGATAVKSKGRGEKSDPGAKNLTQGWAQGLQGAQK